MSDPVKSAEVEDVLSSIRRLVSEDKRPAAAPEKMDAAQDRLVLTPALRVMTDNLPADDAGGTSEASQPADTVEDAVHDTTSNDAPFQLDEPVAEDLSADQDIDEASELVSSDEDHDDDVWVSEPEHEENDQTSAADEAAPTDDTSGDAVADRENTAPEETAGEETATDDADSTVFASFDDQAEEAEAFFEVKEPAVDVAEADGEAGAEDEPVADATAETGQVEPDTAPVADTARAAVSLSSKIAALEAVIGGRDDQWEPDDTGGSDYSGTEAPAMAWDDPDPEPGTGATALPERSDLADAGDLLDEETLREMVSDIVREELQGALGERITRNVRKLVRREIHRALTAQDLD